MIFRLTEQIEELQREREEMRKQLEERDRKPALNTWLRGERSKQNEV